MSPEAARANTVGNMAEFLHIDLGPLADGGLSLSVTAITVDDEEPQLLHQEIASDRVASIDDALESIRQLVRANMV
jgi:hypothetical protein